MPIVEDKQENKKEKKKDVGDCTRSCVGIIVATLVQRASEVFEEESPYSLLLGSPHCCIFRAGETNVKRYQILEKNLHKD